MAVRVDLSARACQRVEDAELGKRRRSARSGTCVAGAAPRCAGSGPYRLGGGTEAGMDTLTLGVVATSAKEHERRLPIHPRHLSRVETDLRQRMFLERGYGRPYGVGDEELEPLVGGLRERAQLIAECDIVLLPKPQHADVAAMRPGQVLWGWPHCVQDAALTQLGIDRRLTIIAWEAMNHYTSDGVFSLHVFHENNELAGYCSVMHALQLRGVHRALRPAARGGRDQLRRHRPRRGCGTACAGRLGRHGADAPQRSRGGRADAAVAAGALSTATMRRRDPFWPTPSAGRWPSSSAVTTLSSTASCRTPTVR